MPLGRVRVDGTQPASGAYTELGIGVLAGKGRTSVSVGGQRCSVPYPRSPARTDAMEPALTAFMSDVSKVLHNVLPTKVLNKHTSYQMVAPKRLPKHTNTRAYVLVAPHSAPTRWS